MSSSTPGLPGICCPFWAVYILALYGQNACACGCLCLCVYALITVSRIRFCALKTLFFFLLSSLLMRWGGGGVRESGIVEVEGGRGRGEVTAWILQCCTIAPCFFTSSEGWHTLMGQTRKWRWWWRSGGWKRLSRIWTPKVLTLTHYLKHWPTPPPWPKTYHNHESCRSNSRGVGVREGGVGEMEWSGGRKGGYCIDSSLL